MERRLMRIAEALGPHYGAVSWSVVESGGLRASESCGVLIDLSAFSLATDTLVDAWETVARVLLAHEWAHVGQLRGIPAGRRPDRRTLECAADLLATFQLERLERQLPRTRPDTLPDTWVFEVIAKNTGQRTYEDTASYPTPKERERCLEGGSRVAFHMRRTIEAENLGGVRFRPRAPGDDERYLYGASSDPLRWSLWRAREELIEENVRYGAEPPASAEAKNGNRSGILSLVPFVRHYLALSRKGGLRFQLPVDTVTASSLRMRPTLAFPWECLWGVSESGERIADGQCQRELDTTPRDAAGRLFSGTVAALREVLDVAEWAEEEVPPDFDDPYGPDTERAVRFRPRRSGSTQPVIELRLLLHLTPFRRFGAMTEVRWLRLNLRSP